MNEYASAREMLTAKNQEWTVAELLESGRCTAQCLCAYDPMGIRTCACPCRGIFHGQLANETVTEMHRNLVWTRLSEVNIKYISDSGSTYCWDDRRPSILGIGSDSETARSELQRVSEWWGHDENPPGYIYSDHVDTSADGSHDF